MRVVKVVEMRRRRGSVTQRVMLKRRKIVTKLRKGVGHPQEVDSGNDSSSSMVIIPAGKVAGEKADEEERGRSAKKLKRKAGKRARKPSASTRKKKQADRGPFDVGHRIKFGERKSDSKSSDDSEDAGSDFRAGPSTKSRQLQLQEYSEHPGRLAS